MAVTFRRLRRPLGSSALFIALLCASAALGGGAARAATGNTPLTPAQFNANLTRQVYGYLPSWMVDGTTDGYLQYSLLSTIAVHSISYTSDGHVDTTSGAYLVLQSGTGATIVQHAHAAGVRIDVSVSFAPSAVTNDAFFANAAAQSTAIADTVGYLGTWGIDGVSLDVEALDSTSYPAYGSFITALRSAVRAANPAGQVSVATNASTSGARMAQIALSAGADRAFMMGYDYRTGGSSPTGAISPLVSFNGILDLTDSVGLYQSAGAPLNKVVLGLPYYGRIWPTKSNTLNSTRNTAASSCSWGPPTPTVAQIPGESAGLTTNFDPLEQTGWFARYDTTNSTWCEAYYDTPGSLTAKYQLAISNGMAGVGMWALGYDQGLTGYWNAIAATFGSPPATYHPITPARILDTRIGRGLQNPLASGAPNMFQVTGQGGVPTNATAVTGNLTVTGQTYRGYVALTPTQTSTPSVSTINFPSGDTRANGVTVQLGPGGTLAAVYITGRSGDHTQLIFDVTGYFR